MCLVFCYHEQYSIGVIVYLVYLVYHIIPIGAMSWGLNGV